MFFHLRKIDWILVIIVLVLCFIGLFTLYPLNIFLFKKQLLFIAIGFFIMIGMSFFDYRILKNNTFIITALYLISLFLLGLVLLFGRRIRGTVGWFDFGSFSFEPVELTKIIIVLLLAKYFSMRHIEMYHIKHIIISGIYIGLPVSLIFLQPDLGSIIIVLCIWLGIILIAGIRVKHLLVLFLVFLIAFLSSWLWVLKDYQKQRIIAFINPYTDPLGYGYHSIQSVIAIGSGKLFGKGWGKGYQAQLNFLPESHSDFIFATFAEQWGFMGVLLLLLLFSLLIWRIIEIAIISRNNFSSLFSVGFAILIFSQSFINIGMNIKILPITGITLPFLSYGGSSLITLFLGIGILQSIKTRL